MKGDWVSSELAATFWEVATARRRTEDETEFA